MPNTGPLCSCLSPPPHGHSRGRPTPLSSRTAPISSRRIPLPAQTGSGMSDVGCEVGICMTSPLQLSILGTGSNNCISEVIHWVASFQNSQGSFQVLGVSKKLKQPKGWLATFPFLSLSQTWPLSLSKKARSQLIPKANCTRKVQLRLQKEVPASLYFQFSFLLQRTRARPSASN